MKTKTYSLFGLAILLIVFACREPYEVETLTFEDILVVESTITNELKHQVVKLSRTFILEESEPVTEENATVWVEDSNNNIYSFSQNTEGQYISNIPFQAINNLEYSLYISTQDGNEYKSKPSILTAESEITNLYSELLTNDDGEEGIQIFLDSENQNSDTRYFRYEYEETYQIIAPNYVNEEAYIFNYSAVPFGGNTLVDFSFSFPNRTQEERVCYGFNNSTGILQASTNDLIFNTVSKLPVHFINKNNGVLRDRYSILVKQYSQSIEAYTFYKVVNELGNIGSVLSQNQPGYVTGNIESTTNPNSKVIGYFSVESIATKRIYFSHNDFAILRPDYLYKCEKIALDGSDNTLSDRTPNQRAEIYRLLTLNADINFNYSITYNLSSSELPNNINDYWILTNPECGDCTSVGSNIQPDFWED
ncbi:DUF4249 family protein [Lacinutrix sp. WUR7]|uniref:DUF4249 domain-containing protein n=1 Tax=Lacinutrix sp. WUR7 TaxID=2653681 RepID=UPI00193DB602|nr:DUF4249 domain-containing protein [Lacinutrix sp. WUR7]QRM90118.1 DUF4249 family protein [Lacinutrix sp. WUR7]